MKILLGTIFGVLALIGAAAVTIDNYGKKTVQEETNTPLAGSYSPTGGGTYRLGQSIGTSDTTIRLSSFKEPVSNILYTMTYLGSDIGYGTISPQSSISEFISFSGITQNSDGSATLTGVLRGISRTPGTGGCVASTTLAQSHPGQSILILSNPPCQIAEYPGKRNTETISGAWTYSTLPTFTNAPTLGTDGVNKTYADNLAFNGAATSTFANLGLVRLATALQIASSTASSTNGLQGGSPLVIPSKYATTTPGVLCNGGTWNCVPVAQVSGYLDQAWLNLTSAFTWTGTHIFNGAVTIVANSANKLTLGGSPTTWNLSNTASSTLLMTDGSGNLSLNRGNLSLLVSTTTQQNMRYATTTFPAATHIMIVVQTQGQSSADHFAAYFNTDRTGVYGYQVTEQQVLFTGISSTNQLNLQNMATTSPEFAVINVFNQSSLRKFMSWTIAANSSAAFAPQTITGVGVYNNTSAQITQFVLDAEGGITFNSGMVISVYGSTY